MLRKSKGEVIHRTCQENDQEYFDRCQALINSAYANVRPSQVLCPFEYCGKVYTSKHSLFRHFLTHNPRIDHVCSYCGKTFGLVQYLKDHLNMHTGEKPYVCDVDYCRASFMQAGRLSQHKKRIHRVMHRKPRNMGTTQIENITWIPKRRKKIECDESQLESFQEA